MVKVGQAKPFGGQVIQVWGLIQGRAITTQIAIAEIISIDQNDIGAWGMQGLQRRLSTGREQGRRNNVLTIACQSVGI